jgi:uncharacterized membrane protein
LEPVSDPNKPASDESEDALLVIWLRMAIPGAFLILAMFGTLMYMHFTIWLLFFGLAIAYILPPAGKETVIPSGVALGFQPWEMVYLLVMLDLAGALFIILNFGFAKRLPVLGNYIRWMERRRARTLKKHTNLKVGVWVGLVLFHMVPFDGSGGITAGIIGRAIGMRTTPLIAAVTTGSVMSGLVVAYAAWYVKRLLLLSWAFGIMMILLVLLAVLLMFVAYRIWRIRKWEGEDRLRGCQDAAC